MSIPFLSYYAVWNCWSKSIVSLSGKQMNNDTLPKLIIFSGLTDNELMVLIKLLEFLIFNFAGTLSLLQQMRQQSTLFLLSLRFYETVYPIVTQTLTFHTLTLKMEEAPIF
jgi:hypothetical protein